MISPLLRERIVERMLTGNALACKVDKVEGRFDRETQ
jgi:hypothetical protein